MSTVRMRNALYSGLLVAITACSPATQEGETNDAMAEAIPLEGTNWQLTQLTVLGGFDFVPADPGKYVLNFRSGNRLTGTSDCNSINGSWQQENAELHFETFSTTLNMCTAGSLHNYLVLYLRDVAAYSFRDGHLILTTPTEGVEIALESIE